MSDDAPSDALALANQIAEALLRRGFECRMIGASAMAVHGYTRATKEIHLATLGLPVDALQSIAEDLRAVGFAVELREPDMADPLRGVIRVRVSDDLEVDVINLGNPWTREGLAVGEFVFQQPFVALEGLGFGAAGLVPLIILKLAAGGRLDLRDAAELLSMHPELDREELRKFATDFGFVEPLNRVIEDANRG